MSHDPVRTGWPATVPVNQAEMIEAIGWEAFLAIADGRILVEHDDQDRPIGLRVNMEDGWWLVVLNTDDGWSVGRYRAMVPFGWLHHVSPEHAATAVQRAAAIGYAWPPTEEDPW